MRIALALFIAGGGALFAQRPEVSISQLPPFNTAQIVRGYSGANEIYDCYSPSEWPAGFPVSVSAATNATPVVLTSASHGFNLSSRPKVTIKGGTGSWVAINGTFTATIIDANTFSIPVDSTAFGALAGTITFTTTAARLNQPQWAVKLHVYDGSGNPISDLWLNGSSAFQAKCTDATSTTTNIQ